MLRKSAGRAQLERNTESNSKILMFIPQGKLRACEIDLEELKAGETW